jgi:hypothetical protein
MVSGLRTTRRAGEEVLVVGVGRETEYFEDILMTIRQRE